jgi:hypothetical protein
LWGGDIRRTDFTHARPGRHILRDALRLAFFQTGFRPKNRPRLSTGIKSAGSIRSTL